jgi:predicted dithiol-disulfide oxidoreductase (DUF899 family)
VVDARATRPGTHPQAAHGEVIGNLRQLRVRNTTLVAVSRAPYEKIAAFRQRMGWTFPWYSSYGSAFNYDFHATLDDRVAPVLLHFRTEAELAEVVYVGEDPADHQGMVRREAAGSVRQPRRWIRRATGSVAPARAYAFGFTPSTRITYPFSPPEAKPSIKRRWRIKNNTITGKIMNRPAALVSPQSRLNWF